MATPALVTIPVSDDVSKLAPGEDYRLSVNGSLIKAHLHTPQRRGFGVNKFLAMLAYVIVSFFAFILVTTFVYRSYIPSMADVRQELDLIPAPFIMLASVATAIFMLLGSVALLHKGGKALYRFLTTDIKWKRLTEAQETLPKEISWSVPTTSDYPTEPPRFVLTLIGLKDLLGRSPEKFTEKNSATLHPALARLTELAHEHLVLLEELSTTYNPSRKRKLASQMEVLEHRGSVEAEGVHEWLRTHSIENATVL